MVEYTVVDTTAEHIEELSATMRQADIDEVWASVRMTPQEALEGSVTWSHYVRTGLADGEVICIYGVGRTHFLSDTGVPWMLASTKIEKHALPFLRHCSGAMEELKVGHATLVNFVDCRNTMSMRWLKWLGFEFEPAAPFGPDGLPFHQFEMRIET